MTSIPHPTDIPDPPTYRNGQPVQIVAPGTDEVVGYGFYRGALADRILVDVNGEFIHFATDEIRPAPTGKTTPPAGLDRIVASIGTTSAHLATCAGALAGIHYWTHHLDNIGGPADERLEAIANIVNEFLNTAAGRTLLIGGDITVTTTLPAAGGGGR